MEGWNMEDEKRSKGGAKKERAREEEWKIRKERGSGGRDKGWGVREEGEEETIAG